jgi:PAS domain S-box-containing protein
LSLTEEPGTPRTRRPGVKERPHESDELYRLLAEHSTDMISKHTPSGVYTYASSACRSLLGYDPEDLVGRDAYELFHPDDFEEVKKTHSAILERPDTHTVVYRIRRKDGSYTWFETTSRTVRNPETDEVLEIIAVSRDVTERKKVEARLRDAEARYRTLVEQIPAITYVAALDEVSSTIYVSPQAEDILGAAPEEWLADPELFAKLLHPEDREQVLSDHVRANRAGAPLRLEYRLTTWAGRVVWVRDESVVVRDVAGRPLFRQGVLLDITDRKEAEEQVLFQAHLLEQVQAAVIATDLRGRVTHWNEYAERLYGWSREETLGRDVRELTVGPGQIAVTEEIVRKVGAGETWEGEFVVRRKDGSRFLAHVTDSLIRDAEGRAAGIVGVSTDVTERKRLEEGLREIREAERRRIARDLHDVVLQDLAGALQGMQAAQVESAGSSGLEQEIAALQRAVGSLRNAIYDLRLEMEQPFVRAVESLVELNRQLTPEREILLKVCDGFPSELPGAADVELLRVLQEALVNARRHSCARRVEVVLSTGHRKVQAEVADDGVGFDPASVREGVGLAGMRERVSALRGRLEIVSTPDQRTSVKVEVPFPGSP